MYTLIFIIAALVASFIWYQWITFDDWDGEDVIYEREDQYSFTGAPSAPHFHTNPTRNHR